MAKPEDGLGVLIGIGPEADEDGDDEATLAARALLKAIRRDDETAVVDAFKQLMDCCDDDYEMEEPDADDEE